MCLGAGISLASVDILQDHKGNICKGSEPLSLDTGLVQCLIPVAVTTSTLHAEQSLMAFGTSHSFSSFDYQLKGPVLTNDFLATEEPFSWIKALRKSLHQSFSHIHKSQVSGKKWVANANSKLQEANMRLMEQVCLQGMGIMLVQHGINPAWLQLPLKHHALPLLH